MKRIFLALKAQIDDYDKLQSDFSGLIKGRWVTQKNLHVTICFLGDTYSVDELLKMMPPLTEVVEGIELKSLGYFKHNDILYAKTKSKKLDETTLIYKEYIFHYQITNHSFHMSH